MLNGRKSEGERESRADRQTSRQALRQVVRLMSDVRSKYTK